MDVLENVILWIANLIGWVFNSFLSLLAWFKPVLDFIVSMFSWLPAWVTVLVIVCIAIELIIFILNLGGE